MDLESLNSFIVLSQYLNYTKAASVLHVTQPTLSKCIVRLERELGKQLIERNNRGVFLTESGCKVLKYAKQMLNQHVAMLDELSIPPGQDHEEYHLRVGFLSHSVHQYLPPFLKEYRSRYPQAQISLFDGGQSLLTKAFLDGRLDVLIATEAACGALEHYHRLLISEEPIRLLVPSDSPYAGMDCVDMEGLKEETFLLLGNNYSYLVPGYNRNNLLLRVCAAHQFFPKVVQCEMLSNLPIMVACKMGLAVATAALQFYAKGCVTFVPIKGHESDMYRIYAFYDDLNFSHSELFARMLQKHVNGTADKLA